MHQAVLMLPVVQQIMVVVFLQDHHLAKVAIEQLKFGVVKFPALHWRGIYFELKTNKRIKNMANKIEYTRKEIINNQGEKVFITIIRLICENQCTEANRKRVLEQAVQKMMASKPYKLFKDDESYEYVIIEGENELKFTDITN